MKVVISSKGTFNMVQYTASNIAYVDGSYVITAGGNTYTYDASAYIIMIIN